MPFQTNTFAGASRSGETYVLYAQLPEVGVPRYSRVHLREMVRNGQFPAPVNLSARRIAWRLSELEVWKATRPTQVVADHAQCR